MDPIRFFQLFDLHLLMKWPSFYQPELFKKLSKISKGYKPNSKDHFLFGPYRLNASYQAVVRVLV